MRSMTLATFALFSLIAGTACESTVTGNAGNFSFSYPTDDNVLDFNKPVAVGARLDLSVATVGTEVPVDVATAAFDDPAVLDVVDISGDTIIIEGVGAGNALLEVKGSAPGSAEAADSVNLNAAVPDIHRLSHACIGENPAYLASTIAWLSFDFELDNGQPVIGYGYYPVEFSEPDTALDVSHQGSQFMKLDLGAPGTVTMSSTLTSDALDLSLVTPDSIDGVAPPTAFVLEDIDVGDVNPFYVRAQSGPHTVCQAAELAYTVVSDTPTVCDVRRIEAFAADGSAEGKEGGWFEIEGLAQGTCSYTVTFPDGNDGAGASGQFTYPIEP